MSLGAAFHTLPLIALQTPEGNAVSAGRTPEGIWLSPEIGNPELQPPWKLMVPAGVPPVLVAKKSLLPTMESVARYTQTAVTVVPSAEPAQSTQPFAFCCAWPLLRLSTPLKYVCPDLPLSVQT